MHASFALLDDAAATPQRPSSRLYRDFVREHRCTDPASLETTCAAADTDLRTGLHAVLLADYEWGVRLQAADRHQPLPADAGSLRLLMFRRCDRLDRAGADAWLSDNDANGSATHPGPAGFADLTPQVDDAEFISAIEQIHEHIRAGETYQVNHTYRVRGQAWGDPVSLYRRLRARQPVPFGALIHLPDGGWVLSCSPELFLRHEQGLLTTKPMKGTAARLAQPEADQATAEWLHDDVKNRAENLMIVDLLRNDLGRIARTGSVKVPALFDIEGYRTVYQMTSTVTAELPEQTPLAPVLRALFPCGSITGAPKHHTMALIARLENTPRGLYTGSIGWLDAPTDPSRALGDFCLNVAIRTATLGPSTGSTGVDSCPATLGVGAGIVLDSKAESEAEECRLKLRFATALDPGFTLFETLRLERGTLRRLDAHLARLARSARELGFRFNAQDAIAVLQDPVLSHLSAATGDAINHAVMRVRLDLSFDGSLAVRLAPLAALKPGPVGFVLADTALPHGERVLLRHKTSLRGGYDGAIAAAEARGAFDCLYLDDSGHLSEGARSNLFVRLNGQWLTPRATGDLLPGVMRAALLSGEVALDPGSGSTPTTLPREADLTPADLRQAEVIVLCNSLRGALTARLLEPGPGRPTAD